MFIIIIVLSNNNILKLFILDLSDAFSSPGPYFSEADERKRQLADRDGYAQAELSPSHREEFRLTYLPHPPGGEGPAPNPNSGEACTIRSRQRSSAGGVTVLVLCLKIVVNQIQDSESKRKYIGTVSCLEGKYCGFGIIRI